LIKFSVASSLFCFKIVIEIKTYTVIITKSHLLI
jgi:hypothetical protein